MTTSSNLVKKGMLLATTITLVFFMSGSGVAGVEKIWTEKKKTANSDVSPVGGTLFRVLAEKTKPSSS